MYFPILRGLLYELQAVRAVAPTLIAANNVFPVIEPVRPQWGRIDRILDEGLSVGVVWNPEVGDYSAPSGRARRVQQQLPAAAAATFARPECYPTLLLRGNTSAATVAAFHAQFARRPHLVLVSSAPRDPAIFPAALAHHPARLMVVRRAVHVGPPRADKVDVADSYVRQERNAGYPFDEFFSDRPVTIFTDPSFESFGDYSTVGARFTEGGTQPNNVAIHLVYSTGGPRTELRIRHYVSAPHPNQAAMRRQALGMLVADLPNLFAMTPLNETATIRELMAIHAIGGDLALGKAKEMAIRHHFELMTVVQ